MDEFVITENNTEDKLIEFSSDGNFFCNTRKIKQIISQNNLLKEKFEKALENIKKILCDVMANEDVFDYGEHLSNPRRGTVRINLRHTLVARLIVSIWCPPLPILVEFPNPRPNAHPNVHTEVNHHA